jgi:hypothetical protein
MNGVIPQTEYVSASLLPRLISKNITYEKQMLAEFPLASAAPNLNGSKFKAFRLRQGALSSQALANAFQMFTGRSRQITPEQVNQQYFVTGSNFRRIKQVLDKARQSTDALLTDVPLQPKNLRTTH